MLAQDDRAEHRREDDEQSRDEAGVRRARPLETERLGDIARGEEQAHEDPARQPACRQPPQLRRGRPAPRGQPPAGSGRRGRRASAARRSRPGPSRRSAPRPPRSRRGRARPRACGSSVPEHFAPVGAHPAQRALLAARGAGGAGAPAVADQQHVDLVGVLGVRQAQDLVVGLVERRAGTEEAEPACPPGRRACQPGSPAGRTRTAGRRPPSCGRRPAATRGRRGPPQPERPRASRARRRGPRGSPGSGRPWWARGRPGGSRPRPPRPARRAPHPSSRSARAGARRPRRGCGRWCSGRGRSARARRRARRGDAGSACRTRHADGRGSLAASRRSFQPRRPRLCPGIKPPDGGDRAQRGGRRPLHPLARGRRRPGPLPARRAQQRRHVAAVPRAQRRHRPRPARLRAQRQGRRLRLLDRGLRRASSRTSPKQPASTGSAS